MRLAVALVILVIIAGAVECRPVKRIKAKHRVALVPYDSVPQLMLSTDPTDIAITIADGTITKSTGLEMVWQASEDSDSAIKEIHTLAGGEEGVVSGRTWVFKGGDWSGLADWASEHEDHIADYASVDTDSGIVEWKLVLRGGDEPDTDNCDNFATSIASGDLAGAMAIASQYFTQDLALDSASGAYAALQLLVDNTTLYAERLDTACLGYKFFSAYDSPTSTVDTTVSTSSTAPTPPSLAPDPPSEIFSD